MIADFLTGAIAKLCAILQAHVMSAMRHAAMALNTNNSFDVEYAIAESNSQLDLLIEKEAIMYASPESGFRNSLSNGDLEVCSLHRVSILE